MTNLKVGLIGLGMMGKNHLRILSSLEGVDLVGLADPLAKVDITREIKGHENFTEYRELLDQGLDYCVISAPTGFHREISVAALNRGVNCLIEKPVSVNYKEALEIKIAADKAKKLVGIGHIERYNSAIRQLKRRLLDGDLGAIYQISLRRQGPFPSRIADVGVVKDLATHDIDLAMWLSESLFASVNAQTTHRSGREHEDLVSINGKLQNGVVVNLLVNWLSPLKERSLVVTGEKGAFVVDTLNSDLTFYENGSHEVSQDSFLHFKGVKQGSVTTFAFNKPEPLQVEHENFRDKLLGKESNIATLLEGIETARVADAVIESSKLGQSIRL
jgi:UDP-N-acetylglucosamine 3-dehydrogenase